MFFEINSKRTRINFRSKGKYVINNVAKDFDGGGHKFASGALAKKELSLVLSEVVEKTKSSIISQNGKMK